MNHINNIQIFNFKWCASSMFDHMIQFMFTVGQITNSKSNDKNNIPTKTYAIYYIQLKVEMICPCNEGRLKRTRMYDVPTHILWLYLSI